MDLIKLAIPRTLLINFYYTWNKSRTQNVSIAYFRVLQTFFIKGNVSRKLMLLEHLRN